MTDLTLEKLTDDYLHNYSKNRQKRNYQKINPKEIKVFFIGFG